MVRSSDTGTTLQADSSNLNRDMDKEELIKEEKLEREQSSMGKLLLLLVMNTSHSTVPTVSG